MTQYAADTSVPAERSRAEIERSLTRYGAAAFMYAWDGDKAVIGFRISDRQVRIRLTMPSRESLRTVKDKGRTTGYRECMPSQIETAWEQACRQRWRALALVVKAKLEAVESGISTVEEEFLSWLVLPNGQNVGEWVTPQLEKAYRDGSMPSMLPALPSGKPS